MSVAAVVQPLYNSLWLLCSQLTLHPLYFTHARVSLVVIQHPPIALVSIIFTRIQRLQKQALHFYFFCHFFTFHLHICVSCLVLSFISSVCQHETVISFLCFFVPPLHVNLFYHSLKSVWWKEARLNQHVGSLLCNDPAMNG